MDTTNRTTIRNGHEIADCDFAKRTAYCTTCKAVVAIAKGASKVEDDTRIVYWRCAFSCGRMQTKDIKGKEHRLSNIDEVKCTADCITCGAGIRIGKAGKNADGQQQWRCYTAIKKTMAPRKTDRQDQKHFLSNVDEVNRKGTCACCGLVDLQRRGPGEGKTAWRCAVEAKSRPNDPIKQRARKLRLNYGLTPEDYDRMFAAQRGLCAICENPPTEGDTCFCVDHCHDSGKVRSLLCRSCNTGLGSFLDSPSLLVRAIHYLQSHEISIDALPSTT